MDPSTYVWLDKFAKLKPVRAVMHIWSGWSDLTQRINFALMLDGYYTFDIQDIDKEFIENKLKEQGYTYKEIIEKSIKFMRTVNYFIVKKGAKYNSENRVTHRGVNASIFQNMKEGQIFRAMHYQCTSEDVDVSKKF